MQDILVWKVEESVRGVGICPPLYISSCQLSRMSYFWPVAKTGRYKARKGISGCCCFHSYCSCVSQQMLLFLYLFTIHIKTFALHLTGLKVANENTLKTIIQYNPPLQLATVTEMVKTNTPSLRVTAIQSQQAAAVSTQSQMAGKTSGALVTF